jgi:hypothetical protein
MSRASEKALERLDAAVRHYGPQFLSKADMRALQRLARRTEAAEREAEGLRDALRAIAAGKAWTDTQHPMGEWFAMAGRFVSIAQKALTQRATKDATRGAGRRKPGKGRVAT